MVKIGGDSHRFFIFSFLSLEPPINVVSKFRWNFNLKMKFDDKFKFFKYFNGILPFNLYWLTNGRSWATSLHRGRKWRMGPRRAVGCSHVSSFTCYLLGIDISFSFIFPLNQDDKMSQIKKIKGNCGCGLTQRLGNREIITWIQTFHLKRFFKHSFLFHILFLESYFYHNV